MKYRRYLIQNRFINQYLYTIFGMFKKISDDSPFITDIRTVLNGGNLAIMRGNLPKYELELFIDGHFICIIVMILATGAK